VLVEEADLARLRPSRVDVRQLTELARVVGPQLHPQPPMFHDRRKQPVAVADRLRSRSRVDLVIDPPGDVVLVDRREVQVSEDLLEVQRIRASVAVRGVGGELAALDAALLLGEERSPRR
jgi:hypothetical protein